MEYILKKSSELSLKEKEGICDLFQRVFHKNLSVDKFIQKYEVNVLGYSYHGLMMDAENIVGAYSSIPYRYRYFDKEFIFALSVDTMIDERHRDFLSLKKLANMVYNALKAESIPFAFGFPNDNVYLYRKKVLHWKDIGTLSFYIMPVVIGKFFKKFRWANEIIRLISKGMNRIPRPLDKGKENREFHCLIEKIVDDGFINHRFSDPDYIQIRFGNNYGIYKTVVENNIRIAYIIDIYPLEKECFESLTRYIYERVANDIDAVIYVGNLSFSPVNMFKVPVKYEPRKIHMSGMLLLNDVLDDRIYDMRNWCINLSNFDVR